MPGQGQAIPRQVSEVATKERKLQLAMFLEHNKTRFSTVCIGTLVVVFCLGAGATLIILGIVYSNNDCLILGCIFAFGGIVFSVLFTIGQCRPYLKNRKIYAEYTREINDTEETKKPVQVGNYVSYKTKFKPGNYPMTTTTEGESSKTVTFY